MECPIVLVRYKGVSTPVRLNKSDYDANPSAYVLWDGEPAPVTETTKPTVPQYLVTKVGKVFMVVDMAGNFIDVPGIDAGGYSSEMDAWTAVAALSK